MRRRVCVSVLFLLALRLSLTWGDIDCSVDSEYLMEMSDRLELRADCQSNGSTIFWSVEEPPITSNGEIIINYQCSLEDATVFSTTRLKRVSLGGDYNKYKEGEAVHPAPNITLLRQQQLVCEYFGCFSDSVDGYVYLFDPVYCTFSKEPDHTTQFSVSLSPTNVRVSPITLLTPSPSPPTIVTNNRLSPPSPVLSDNYSSKSSPSFTLSDNKSLTRSAVKTIALPSPPSLTLSDSVSIIRFMSTRSAVKATAAVRVSSYYQKATVSTTNILTNSSSLPQLNNGDVLVAALLVCVFVFITVGGVLFTIAIGTYCSRRRREYKHPLKVIPGINDDLRIDPNFSPVNEAPLSTSTSAISIATVLDKFSQNDHPQTHSMTSLQLQYLYDGVTEWFNSESVLGEKVHVVGDSSEYVQLYLKDSSGFTDDHSYFSVSQSAQQENKAQEKVFIERFHENKSTQSVEKLKDFCIDLLDTNNCQNPNSIEPINT